MGKIEIIQQSIQDLTPTELAELRAWLDELEERLFDEKLERGIKARKFDQLAEEALRDHRDGKTKLPRANWVGAMGAEVTKDARISWVGLARLKNLSFEMGR